MKRISFILGAALLCGSLLLQAQENQVNRIPSVGSSSSQTDYSYVQSGFWFAVELTGGSTVRIDSRNMPFGELDVTAGYRFTQFLKVGVGVGGRYFANNDAVRFSSIPWDFPLYVNIRGNFIDDTYRTAVPYYSLDVGGALRDGVMVRPTIGVRFGEPRGSFLLGLSYIGQDTKSFEYDSRCIRTSKNKFISMAALRLGYEF